MFCHVLFSKNYINQLDLVNEAIVEISDHFDDHNVRAASQLVEAMRTNLQQLKVHLNFILSMQLLQVARRLQQQHLRQYGRLPLLSLDFR